MPLRRVRAAMLSRSLRNAKALKSSVSATAGAGQQQQQKRCLSVHEYQAMGLLNSYGISTPESKPAFSASEALSVAQSFANPNELVIKAQVLAGGRGKGHFDGPNGLKGGVQMVSSPEQAQQYAEQMIGHNLITKQTGAAGRICNAVRSRFGSLRSSFALMHDFRSCWLPSGLQSKSSTPLS